MVDHSNIKLNFFLAVELFDGIPEMGTDLFFSFLELVQILIVFVELRIDCPLAVVQPNIKFLRSLYLAANYLFLLKLLQKIHPNIFIIYPLLISLILINFIYQVCYKILIFYFLPYFSLNFLSVLCKTSSLSFSVCALVILLILRYSMSSRQFESEGNG
jgi:hypothetical protein